MPSILCYDPDYDNDSRSTLSFGRKPSRKRQRDGLNAKMGQMLQRVALTAVPYAEAANRRRDREKSKHSTSSEMGVAETLVEDIHNSARGGHVGESFSVIKSGSSPPSMRRSDFLRSDVPSWRGQEKEQLVSQEKLPDWLSLTFTTLEPGHPLRTLAISETTDERSFASASLTHEALLEATLIEEEDSTFAFSAAPQIPNVPEEKDMFTQAPLLSAPHSAISSTLISPADNFQPFSTPGPFAPKTVHFLSPVHEFYAPPVVEAQALFDDSQSGSLASPIISTPHKPFASPGPTAKYRAFSPSEPAQKHISSESDSLTLADEQQFVAATELDCGPGLALPDADIEAIAHTVYGNPGPIFSDVPFHYFDSPASDPILDEEFRTPEVDGIQALGGYHAWTVDDDDTFRFSVHGSGSDEPADHTAHAHDTHENSVNHTLAHAPQANGNAETNANASNLDDSYYTTPQDEAYAQGPATPCTPLPIELFSSPPYIRFGPRQQSTQSVMPLSIPILDTNETTTCQTPAFSPALIQLEVRRCGRDDTDLQRPLSTLKPAFIAQQQEASRPRDAFDATLMPHASTYLTSAKPVDQHIPKGAASDSDSSAFGSSTKVMSGSTPVIIKRGAKPNEKPEGDGDEFAISTEQPKPRKARPAFAPAPGIYIPPLDDSFDAEENNNDANINAKEDAACTLSASQFSDDSIEDWE